MRKKILYLQHIDWNWIKQRPQYIAESLSKNNDVLVLYKFSYVRKGLQKRDVTAHNDNLKIKKIFRLPSSYSLWVERVVNMRLMTLSVKYYIKKYKPDCIYITAPEQVEMLPKKPNCQVIYDCMDNHMAFSNDKKEKELIYISEKKLVVKATNILVSSNKLKEHLKKCYGDLIETKISVIRNGYNGKILEVSDYKKINNKLKLTYIGTVASWFDNQLILKSLEEFSQLEYEIIGPVANDVEKIIHERVKYLGTVEHNALPEAIKDTDCLIMPFHVNELIEAVDPVKFYEYINFNRNIISVYYEEIKRFQPFVEFYNTYEEYRMIIKKLQKDNSVKYSNSERLEFLENNKWEKRVSIIDKIINE